MVNTRCALGLPVILLWELPQTGGAGCCLYGFGRGGLSAIAVGICTPGAPGSTLLALSAGARRGAAVNGRSGGANDLCVWRALCVCSDDGGHPRCQDRWPTGVAQRERERDTAGVRSRERRQSRVGSGGLRGPVLLGFCDNAYRARDIGPAAQSLALAEVLGGGRGANQQPVCA